MKILVFGDQLVVGGSQVNAIELAAAMRDLHGFDIVYFAVPGPMVEMLERKRLRFRAASLARMHPSVTRMSELRKVVAQEKPDLIHAWDWWQAVDAFYGSHVPSGVPILVSHMLMDLTRVLPKRLPTTYGTLDLRDQAKQTGRGPVEVLVPPVDVELNAPGVVDPCPFRNRFDIRSEEVLLVTVSRLHSHLKAESLFASIDAVRLLGADAALKLVIVGDGDLRPQLEQLAAKANSDLSRNAISLAGEMLDPRSAYAAADIVVGMGGSALRGMAFAKPTIIVGEDGFAKLLSPETAGWFLKYGIYGRGRTPGSGLAETIDVLARSRNRLPELGAFSREFVVQNYSLQSVSARLAEIYHAAALLKPSLNNSARDAVRTGILLVVEGKLVPYWSLRRAYHDLGGPPLLPWMRAMRERVSKAAARLSGAHS